MSTSSISVLDRLRLELAVADYDARLDLAGVPGRTRRDLRRELRANLIDSARAKGVRAALTGLGSPWALAAEDARAVCDPSRPAWSLGITCGLTAALLYVFSFAWQVFGFLDGARAVASAGQVTGGLTLYPGSRIVHEWGPDGLSAQLSFSPWPPLVLWVVVALIVARVWRLARRRSPGGAATRDDEAVVASPPRAGG